MSDKTVSSAAEKRLQLEREAIDRDYNDALTALDRALPQFPELPIPPSSNDSLILPKTGANTGGGLKGLVKRFLWRFLGSALQQPVIDHINRNLAHNREVILTLNKIFASQALFQHKHILHAQQITPYLNTKYPVMPLSAHEFGKGLAAGLDGLGDEIQKRDEANIVREQRFGSQVEELRATIGALQQKLLLLTRQLEQQVAGEPVNNSKKNQSTPQRTSTHIEESASNKALTESQLSSETGAFKYVGFEEQFRGSPEEIRARINEYVPDFIGASDVLDVGCGRGEFLDVLKEHGVTARGLDINPEMVKVCLTQGLDVSEGDAVSYLEGLEDGSLGGLFSAQVVEHLPPEYLIRLLDLAFQKLRPGSKIILETINPKCWVAFFDGYIRDITHAEPLHPDTLTYLLHANGFQRASVRYSAPYPEHAKLQTVKLPETSKKSNKMDPTTELVTAFNDAAEKINGFLFTHLDYAVVAERL